MLAFHVIYSSFASRAAAAPIQNDAATVGWVSDPNGRGTLGLILSCLLTLGLCVWSAMHLNIPQKDETRPQYWARNCKWVLLGVLIPELVVLSAWRQWLSAKQMTLEMKKILEREKLVNMESSSSESKLIRHASSSSMRRFEWTFVHSMYAGMGGFAFDMDLLPEDYGPLFPNQQRLTLTASGALNVARCGYLPDVSLREINDKSKADGLAKALVCLQAGWMVLQTLGRMWAREPVTLLEVNTLGHVFCTFIIYLLWWHKPREVREPTVIQGPQVHLLCTYSYMASRISGRRPDQRFCLDKWRKPELSRYGWFTHADTETLPKVDTPQTLAPPSPPLWRPSQVSFDLILEQSEQPLSHGSTKTFPGHFGPRPESEPEVELKTIIKRGTTFAHRLISGDTSENQHCRRRLATEAIWTFPPLQQKLEPQVFVTPSGNRIDWLEPHLEQLVVTTAGDWPSDHYLPGIAGELMGMALWFASMGYGAVHAAAWQEYFPSDAEKFMWRFSSVYITCAGAIWFGACIIGWRFHWASLYWDRFIALQARWYDYAFWGLFATACGLAYVVARLFLVVDAIVSLRSMPATAYNTPNWSTLIPHL